jgi:hypothetical protein
MSADEKGVRKPSGARFKLPLNVQIPVNEVWIFEEN